MISLEKLNILTPLHKLPKNVGDLGKLNCWQRLWKVAQSPINRPIWSNWMGSNESVSIFASFGSKISEYFTLEGNHIGMRYLGLSYEITKQMIMF